MGNQKIKFRMTLKELSFEFEGDRETGQRLQSDIRKTLTQIGNAQERILPGVDSKVIDAEATPVQENGRNSRRSSRPRRSKGNTPRALIISLRQEGFFSEKREANAIQEELRMKVHNFKSNEISAALVGLVKKSILKRDQADNGNFQYEAGDLDVDEGSSDDAE